MPAKPLKHIPATTLVFPGLLEPTGLYSGSSGELGSAAGTAAPPQRARGSRNLPVGARLGLSGRKRLTAEAALWQISLMEHGETLLAKGLSKFLPSQGSPGGKDGISALGLWHELKRKGD